MPVNLNSQNAWSWQLYIPFGYITDIKNGVAKYALYPVWLLNTTWNGKQYSFAMNGQTGKFAGDLPLDKEACGRWFVGVLAATSAIVFAITYLAWLL